MLIPNVFYNNFVDLMYGHLACYIDNTGFLVHTTELLEHVTNDG